MGGEKSSTGAHNPSYRGAIPGRPIKGLPVAGWGGPRPPDFGQGARFRRPTFFGDALAAQSDLLSLAARFDSGVADSARNGAFPCRTTSKEFRKNWPSRASARTTSTTNSLEFPACRCPLRAQKIPRQFVRRVRPARAAAAATFAPVTARTRRGRPTRLERQIAPARPAGPIAVKARGAILAHREPPFRFFYGAYLKPRPGVSEPLRGEGDGGLGESPVGHELCTLATQSPSS